MSSSKTPEGVSHNGLLYCDATAVAARLVKPLRTIEKERGQKKNKNNHENGEGGLRTHAPSGAHPLGIPPG